MMREAFRKTIGIGLLLFSSAAAQAATVIFDPMTTNATAILGLDVDGDTVADYDVTFWNRTDADPDLGSLTSPTPCGGGVDEPPCGLFEFVNLGSPSDPGDVTGAEAAADAIAAALNTDGAESTGSSSQINLGVIFQLNANACGDQGKGNCGYRILNSGNPLWSADPAEFTLTASIEYAVFAPAAAPVPLPPAVWLFASGLAMLGWVQRRKG